MMNRINAQKDIFPDIICELRKSNIPLVIYGVGISAENIQQKLRENGIIPHSFIVDQKNKCSKIVIKEKIYDCSSLLQGTGHFENLKKCNLFIASYPAVEKPIEEYISKFNCNNKINKIYLYDDTLFNHFQFTNSYFRSNKDKFKVAYNLFHDSKSREIFCAFINTKISGDLLFLKNLAQKKQYFIPELQLQEDEIFIDVGAYKGDSVIKFIKFAGANSYKKIYAVEPDKTNFDKLALLKDTIPNLFLLNIGLWSQRDRTLFESNSNYTSKISTNGNSMIEVDTIDNLFISEKVTFVKMDIEGSELQALQGAKRTIQRNKPKLAICVYHKKEDLINIPHFIKEIVPEYKLYLRIHCHLASELVLYATL